MTKISLIVGIVLALATAWMLNQYVNEVEQAQVGASYLKLKPNVSLAAGDVLRGDHLETIEIPERFSSLSALAIKNTADSRAWLVGRRASSDVAAGSLLRLEDFSDEPAKRFAASIANDMRAMSIRVNVSSAVGYFIEPGSHVDLVGTIRLDTIGKIAVPVPENIRQNIGRDSDISEQLKAKYVTKTILQNIKVLAVGKATTRGSYLGSAQEGYKNITIEVSPIDAEKLIFAQSQLQGDLFVLLRNPEDSRVQELPVVNWKDLN